MQYNPFEVLANKLDKIENAIQLLSSGAIFPTGGANNTTAQNSNADILTVDEAAKYLTLSKSTIYSLVCQRMIPFMKPGKRLYFSKKELAKWMENGRVQTNRELAAEARQEHKEGVLKRTK